MSYIAVIIGLLMMRVHSPARASAASPLEHMMEGFRFVAGPRPIRAMLLLLGVVSLVGMPYAVLMPIFADQILHGGARGSGHSDGRNRRGSAAGRADAGGRAGVKGLGRWVALCCGGFGLSLIVFSLSQ